MDDIERATQQQAAISSSPIHPNMAELAAVLSDPLEMHIRGAAAANYVLLAMRHAGRGEFMPSDFERLLQMLNLGDATAAIGQRHHP